MSISFKRLFFIIAVFFGLPILSASIENLSKKNKVYFGNPVMKEIIDRINKTKTGEAITIETFVATDSKLKKALIDAHDRGVNIKLSTSNKFKLYGNLLTQLKGRGVPINYKEIHEKLIKFNKSAFLGSRNFSNQAYFNAEVLQEISSKPALKAIDDILENRKKNKNPVQALSPVRKNDRPNKVINTPKRGETKIYASEVVSPNRVAVEFLKSISKTPEPAPKNKRKFFCAIMNTNDNERDGEKRPSFLEALNEAVINHPSSEFTALFDKQTSVKPALQKQLTTIAKNKNSNVMVHNPPENEKLLHTCI